MKTFFLLALTFLPVLKPPAIVSCTVQAPSLAKAGQSFEVSIILNVQDNWYVYAPTTTNANQGMTETRIDFEFPNGFSDMGKMKFPAPVPHGRYQVYEGKGIKATQTLTTQAALEPGKYTIRIHVRYQTCSSHICLAPNREELSAEISIQ